MNLNKVMLIGRLGKKPEVNYIKPDVPVARFSLATSESYKNKDGERVDTTEWHNIVAWRGNAKFAESYLDKGMLIYLEGKSDGSQPFKQNATVADQEKTQTPQAPVDDMFDPIDDALKSDIDDDLPF
jgi:single-strand DNA-binding protein